jgi:hypothetical protein
MFQVDQSVYFPLTGPWAILTAGLEFVVVFVTLELFAYFVIKYVRSSDRMKTGRNLAWCIIILGLSGEYIAWIIGDYFTTDINQRNEIEMIAYTILSIGTFASMLITEQIEHSKHRPFSIISGVLFFLVLIFLILQIKLTVLYIVVGSPLAIAFFIHYYRNLARMANYNREVTRPFIAFFTSMVLILVGFLLISDFWLPYVGLTARIISGFVVIAGANLFLSSVERMPSFGEFDWVNKIAAILVIHDAGLTLFSRFWRNGQIVESNDNLMSSVLSTVESVLKEMMGQDRVDSVVLEGKHLMFEYRDHFSCVVIAEESLASLQIRLKEFTDQFSALFDPIIENWNGNLGVFLPAETIADKIFKAG